MSILVKGKLWMDELACIHCSNGVKVNLEDELSKCSDCGALYKIESKEVSKNEVIISCSFEGYGCIQHSFINIKSCQSQCPSPYMFCETHSTEKCIEQQKEKLQSMGRDIDNQKSRLDLMEKSRATWLIMELSGINEKDTVSKD